MESKKTYSEDHVLAMFEEIKGQNKVAIEQYSGLSERVDLILEDIDGMKSDIVDMKRDIGELKSDMVEVKRDIVDMKKDIVEIKDELVDINVKLDTKSEKSVADNHEKRILKLEKTSLATA